MNIINILNNFFSKKIVKYGAQYSTFAIYGLINYPLALLFETGVNSFFSGTTLRFIATILCFILLLRDRWPSKLKVYLPLYWYILTIISLSFLGSFLVIKSNFSFKYLMNFNIGVMIAILLLDWVSFIWVEIIGITISILYFLFSGHKFHLDIPEDELSLFIYMFLCIVVLGIVFTRNKEIYFNIIQKTKDDINVTLAKLVAERTVDLEKALAAKTEFLNNISHEIRTPVQGFWAISDCLNQDWDQFNDNQKHYYTNEIAKNADRLANLVNNLLDISSFNGGNFILSKTEFDILEIIHEVIDEAKTLYLKDKNIDFSISGTKQIITADKLRIIQVFRNIIFNAIKFSNNHDKISIKLDKITPDTLEITISDQGLGIPENEIEKIFEPFTQSTRTKTGAGGTGLGLSIVRLIISAHQGKIWAKNNFDIGSSFYIQLPIS